jgi:hypothetical protein
MGETIVEKALKSLGKGFDLTSDFRLKFCKGEERLVLLNEVEKRELAVPGFGSIRDVSVDIKCDKGDRTRYQSDILTFTQVSSFRHFIEHLTFVLIFTFFVFYLDFIRRYWFDFKWLINSVKKFDWKNI